MPRYRPLAASAASGGGLNWKHLHLISHAGSIDVCSSPAAVRGTVPGGGSRRAAATVRSTTRARTGVAAAPSPEESHTPRPAPPAAAPPSCCDVAVASLRRPCFATLLARELAMHPALLIAGAGPEPMLADVGLASSKPYPTCTPTPTPTPYPYPYPYP